MVVKGKFTKKAPKPTLVVPKNMNPFIETIAALVRKPHQQRATDILFEVANAVAPLMQHFNLKVRMLQEMSPKKAELLGLNVNFGAKILLRLRPHGIDDAFLSIEEIMGTMLHELVHNTIGPHDQRFYKKLKEYDDMKSELERKGITTIYGKGEKLGGNRAIDIQKARLKKFDVKYHGGVYTLGGGNGNSGKDNEKKSLQELVREATIRRIEDAKWCHEPEEGDIPGDDELEILEGPPPLVIGDITKRPRSDDLDDDIKKRRTKGLFVKRDEGELEAKSLERPKSDKMTPEVEVIDLTSD